MSPQYLTKQEIASLLHVTTRTISSYQKSGVIPPPLKVGRRSLWDRGTLINFIEKQITQQSEQP